ncbi:MAG: hypothetical protein WDN69_30730 [Aliidongia sp.]
MDAGLTERVAASSTAEARVPFVPAEIQLVAGELPRNTEEVEAALVEANLGIYQRSLTLVRVGLEPYSASGGRTISGPKIIAVEAAFLRLQAGRAVHLERFDKRSDDWTRSDVPMTIIEGIQSRAGYWQFPRLDGLINGPTLRPDGTILHSPGFDEQSGLLLVDEGSAFPWVSTAPVLAEAQHALSLFDKLLGGFPFLDAVDRAVWLSAVLSAVARYYGGAIPMHCISATAAGSGKSMLADMVAIIATGRPAPVLSQAAKDEEMEKRLAGAILAGDRLLMLDNCDRPIESALLCQAISQPALKLRALGSSTLADLPGELMVIATGNNLRLVGDLGRRSILCRLDAKVERPELRRFAFDPIEYATANRGHLLWAALTILRAYIYAGMPEQHHTPLGGFASAGLGWCAVHWSGSASKTRARR